MNSFDAINKETTEKEVIHRDYNHSEVLEIGVSEFRLYSRYLRVLGWHEKGKRIRIQEKKDGVYETVTKVYQFPIVPYYKGEYEVISRPDTVAPKQEKRKGLTITEEDKKLMEAIRAKVVVKKKRKRA